jgi:hypothetical protein
MLQKSNYLLLLACWCWGCQRIAEEKGDPNPPVPIETLVAAQCARCHLAPAPQDLDRFTWQQYVLPRMGYFLGIYDQANPRRSLLEPGVPALEALQIYPTQPLLDSASWQAIKDYFSTQAPARLPPSALTFAGEQTNFRAQFPDFFRSPPGTILTRFSNKAGYFVGDVNQEKVWWLSAQNDLIGTLSTPGGAVDVMETADALYLTTIGSFSPSDRALGQLLKFPFDRSQPAQVLISQLVRPVNTTFADLNDDGREDAIIAEFGKWTGQLAWWENTPTQGYVAHPLRSVSGAIRTIVLDLNRDGRMDILALFGQGDEGFWAFYNQGNGQFREENLLRFPPSYGSANFTLIDWNQDGWPDILYTNGDNADYSPVVKPYHGIRLFLNDHGTFRESWFQPLPGAYQTQAADFDLDGDLDLLAISFFPDFAQQPQQALVLFKNDGQDNFSAFSFPQAQAGRWITMDTHDWDHDGDQDVLLGSLAFEVVPPNGELDNWVKNGLGWMLLENLVKK